MVELVGKTGAVVPEQMDAMAANVGVTVGVTVTVIVCGVPRHVPATDVGVTV